MADVTPAPSPVEAATAPGGGPVRRKLYSLGEEIANSVSHGVGVLLSIAALVLLIVVAVSHGGGVRLAAALLMGISLIVEYLFSTLYHAIAPERAKAVFRVLDHCGIYLLIAGSYAPFSLITLADRGGVTLCCAVWAVAAVSAWGSKHLSAAAMALATRWNSPSTVSVVSPRSLRIR